MPKLHLVGITPDHKGLVLSEHAWAKYGDLVLEIDDRLVNALEKAQRGRAQLEGPPLASAALPTRRQTATGDGSPGTHLSPREIQQRLRMGETVAALARSSGVDEAWIERFADPVLAEVSRIIERSRALTFVKPKAGASGATLGPSVAANVIDRGVALTLPDIDAGWGAHQRPGGGWCVSFTFSFRGRRQIAEWDVDLAQGELVARSKLASELGYRASGKKLPQPAAAPPAPTKGATKARAQVPLTRPGQATPQSLPGTETTEDPNGLDADESPGADDGPTFPAGAMGPVTMAQRPGPAPVKQPVAPPETTPRATAAPAPPAAAAKKSAAAAKKSAAAAKKSAAPGKKPAPGARRATAPVKRTPPARKAASPVVAAEPAVATASAEPDRLPAEALLPAPGPGPMPDEPGVSAPAEPAVAAAAEPQSELAPMAAAETSPEPAPVAPAEPDPEPTGPISLAARPGPAPVRPRTAAGPSQV